MAEKYDRLYAAVITPFKPGMDELDEAAQRSFLRYFMQSKFVDAGGGIVINPEAGEVFYLSREEARRNVEIAVEECGDKVPVFAGVIALTTKETITRTRDAKAAGAHGVFLIPPLGAIDVTSSWNPEKYPEVWIDMAKEVCDAVDLPAITHPVAPGGPVFGVGLPLSATLKMCTEIPQIIGWKMTYSYDGYRIIARALREFPRHVGIFAAAAVRFHENLATGQFDGTVSGSFNYAMEPMIDHIQAWQRRDVRAAQEIWDSGMAVLHEFVYGDYSRLHIRYKTACWLRGLIPEPFMRPPLPKPKVEEVRTLRDLLQQAGLNVISDKAVERFFPLA
jgi:4-hydroxy-tetrahydrodipicolinate synthase